MTVQAPPENARSTPDSSHYAERIFLRLIRERLEVWPAWERGARGCANEVLIGRLTAAEILGPQHPKAPAPAFTYFLRLEQPTARRPIKIGTSVNPTDRMESLACGSPYPLTLLATYPGHLLTEPACHAAFARERIRGEWFRPSRRLLAFVELVETVKRREADWVTPWQAAHPRVA